jgi:glyoxylate reductase
METGKNMQGTKAKVFVTRRLPEVIEQRMQDLFDVTLNPTDKHYESKDLIAAVAGHAVMLSTITDRLDAEMIAALPESVKMIAQFGNGVDNIDVEAARKRDIIVTNTPSVLTQDTADMTMALILSVLRRLVEGAEVLRGTTNWQGWSPTWMLGRRLSGMSLGIVGMGRIGTAVAQRARAFGLNIHYYSRKRRPPQIEEPLEATHWENLDEMLAHVDIVSLHLPHTKESFNLLNEDRLKQMKRGGVLVNVSRPELIDEDALVGLIESGHVGGAGLDVFENGHALNPRLATLAKEHKVVLTPHMASATLESRVEMGETVIVNIRVFLDGHKPPHRILPENVVGGR